METLKKAEYPIEPKETWFLSSATSLQSYMTCPRGYFYRSILGWKLDVEKRNDKKFGEAWHKAMAYILKNGYGKVDEAYSSFLECYREKFPEVCDEDYTPKTPANAYLALYQYIDKYKNDNFEVLAVEVAGSVPLTAGRLHFVLDAICKGDKGIFVLEHKTTKSFNRTWLDRWRLSMQIGTYFHTACCMYGKDNVQGVIVNGVAFKKPPRLKADGTPYAGSSEGNEFLRVPIMKAASSMENWLWTADYYLSKYKMDLHLLSKCKISDYIMKCFPLNPESCTKYWGCPYLDFCTAWENPLKRAEEPPVGFTVEFYDPRKHEQQAEKIVHIS